MKFEKPKPKVSTVPPLHRPMRPPDESPDESQEEPLPQEAPTRPDAPLPAPPPSAPRAATSWMRKPEATAMGKLCPTCGNPVDGATCGVDGTVVT